MNQQTPKAQILNYLRGGLFVVINPRISLNSKGPSIINLFLDSKLEIIGVFNAPVFHFYPRKITEVLNSLELLVRKVYPVVPQGKLVFEVIEKEEQKSMVTLSFSSENRERDPYSLLFTNNNAYEAASLFLQVISSTQ